jgi:hypothetical protein
VVYAESVKWDKDVVYNCMWNLLVQLCQHYAEDDADLSKPPIKKVLMTGLATGVGEISVKR